MNESEQAAHKLEYAAPDEGQFDDYDPLKDPFHKFSYEKKGKKPQHRKRPSLILPNNP